MGREGNASVPEYPVGNHRGPGVLLLPSASIGCGSTALSFCGSKYGRLDRKQGFVGGIALNHETVEQAIRRHERWLAEQENAIQQHTDAILKHDEALRKNDEWREEFWSAMGAATERADRMDKRLERFEREGRRQLAEQDARIAALTDNQASADARIAALADGQVTLQAALEALTAQVDRFLRGQQRDGHE